MNSGNHRILYKRPHPDFFRKTFTLCFCLSQNVSPVISPRFRNFLFPVPPSFSCNGLSWGRTVPGDTVCTWAKAGPQARVPTDPPALLGGALYTPRQTPSKLPLSLDQPSSVPHSFPAPGQPSHCPGYSPILPPLGIPPQLHLHPENFLP